MATYYAASTTGSPAGNDGNSGTAPGSPWTLAKTARTAAPGDTVFLRGGTYTHTSASDRWDTTTDVVNSGSLGGGYITYQNYLTEVPTITIRCRIASVSYVKFVGISWLTGASLGSNSRWLVDTGTGGTNIIIDGCTFDCSDATGSAAGVHLTGSDYVFRNNKVKRFEADGVDPSDESEAILYSSADNVIVVDNDWSQCRGGHSCLALENCSNWLVARNYFRNPIARALLVEKSTGQNTSGIVEDNCFIDCDSETQTDSDGQVVRWSGEKNIFRNNVLVGSNMGTLAQNDATIGLNIFNEKIHSRNHRFYHNVVHKNRGYSHQSISYTSGTNPGVDIQGNKFLNNVFSDFGPPAGPTYFCIRLDRPGAGQNMTDAQWQAQWKTCRWLNNIMHDPSTTTVISLATESPVTYTVTAAQGAGGGGNPALGNAFQQNIGQAPIFADATDALFALADADPTDFSLANRQQFLDAYKLHPTSPGYQLGRQLATVQTAGTGVTTITLDDSLCFSALSLTIDGSTITPDRVIIGTNGAVAITARPSDTTITVATPINVAVGDKVYLERTGTTPSIGLFDAVPAPPDPPDPAGTGFGERFWFDGLVFAGVPNSNNDPGFTKFWQDGLPADFIFSGISAPPPGEEVGQPIIRRYALSGTFKVNRPGIGVS